MSDESRRAVDRGLGLRLDGTKPPTWYARSHELETVDSWEDLLGESQEATEAIHVWREWQVRHPKKLVQWDFHGRARALFELLAPPPLIIRERYGFTFHEVASFVAVGFSFGGPEEMLDLWAERKIPAAQAAVHMRHYRDILAPAGMRPEQYVAAFNRTMAIRDNSTRFDKDDISGCYVPSPHLVEWSVALSDSEVRLLLHWNFHSELGFSHCASRTHANAQRT